MKKIQNTMFFCFMLLHVCINGTPGGWGDWNYGDQNAGGYGGYNNFEAPATGSNGWGYGNTNAGGYGGASNGWGYGDQPYAGSHGYSSYWAPAAGDEDSFSNQFSNLLPADPYAHYGNIPHNSGHSHLYSQNNSAHGGGGGGYATYPSSNPTNNNSIDRRPAVHTPPAADQQRKQHHSNDGPSAAAGGHDEQSSDKNGHDEQSSDESGNSKEKHMQQSTTNKQQSSTSSHGEEKLKKSFSIKKLLSFSGKVASNKNECFICKNEIKKSELTKLPRCKHTFHTGCFEKKVFNNKTTVYLPKCPICSEEI